MTIALALVLAAVSTAPDVLLDTEALAGMTDAIPVDAREAEAFEAEHIPGAAHLDYNTLSEDRDGVTGLLKPLNEVHALLAAAGLDPEKTIVVYSGMDDGRTVVRATRLFWVLEFAGYPDVRLLDGGLAKWKAEGRPIESGESTVTAVKPEKVRALKTRDQRYATRTEVQEAQAAKKGLLVDLRGHEYFTGKSKSDSAPRAGRIPGARNMPGTDVLEGPHYTFKPPNAIRDLLAADDQAPGTPLVTYCNTGRSATIGYAALRIAGFEDVAVYDGSMSEWGQHAECPISTGATEAENGR